MITLSGSQGSTTTLGQATSAASSPVVLASDQIVPTTQKNSVTGNLTRTSDGNAYLALDTISNSTSAPIVITFTNLARVNGGSGIIAKAQLFTSQKTCTAQFKLHLFMIAPTAINDNAPYTTLSANNANKIGEIIFPAVATEDPTGSDQSKAIISLDGIGSNMPLMYIAATADKNVYGVLQTLSAFTPDSAQTFTIKLGVIND